jgi:hypothetical protein
MGTTSRKECGKKVEVFGGGDDDDDGEAGLLV